ncbi:hypothetical protein UY3_19255 [Chelonia mydas]|uniref:G-protein coupled receptors family 1 profile domain-containing protein n=1 Tax=Chelonia mydas TaxID=8469 RepID=M7ALV3_CHEMY|nr:hypothetical protein UY3_19255 [Chelonia mydas]
MQSSSAEVTMMESQNRKRAPAWTEREVRDLIAVWGEESVLSELRSSFQDAKTFVKISQGMKDRGHNRDPKQCRVKLKELRQAYQKTREANGCSGSEPQTCRFNDELRAILGVQPPLPQLCCLTPSMEMEATRKQRKLMEKVEWSNQAFITEFMLLGFGNLPELQTPLFLLFLVIYTVTMAGNILTLVIVVADQNLHTPMYFFLGNLVYLAIYNPLHYAALMRSWVHTQLVSGSWIMAFFTSTLITLLMARLTFCGPNKIDHFFCDFAPMLKLSCSDTSLIELVDLILSFAIILPTFLLTMMCYVCNIATILRIPSTTGRQMAFSTCSSHLIIVVTFYGPLIISYMISTAGTAGDLHKVLSVFYTVLTPLVNPLIYSLRNKMVKEALKKVGGKLAAFMRS